MQVVQPLADDLVGLVQRRVLLSHPAFGCIDVDQVAAVPGSPVVAPETAGLRREDNFPDLSPVQQRRDLLHAGERRNVEVVHELPRQGRRVELAVPQPVCSEPVAEAVERERPAHCSSRFPL